MANHVFGKSRRNAMSLLYLIGGVLALGILIYLLIALLKPEVFS
jgi:K+-transporting ATPase KdpF subunit